MFGINLLAVIVAAIVAFIVSSGWYIVFGKERMKLLGVEPDAMASMQKTPAWKPIAEVVRSFIVAFVLAHFIALLGPGDWIGAVSLGLWAWLGFPVMILLGSVQWENVPLKLAAIHAGDWFLKLLLMAVLLGLWR